MTSVTPAAGSTGAPVSVAPTATFSQPVTPGTVSFTVTDSASNTVNGTVSFNGAHTVATFTPASSLAAGTTYTATVSGAQNTSGTPMASPFSWSFSTAATAQCPCSIWQNAAPSGAADAADTSAVNLGLQFQASSDGMVTGIRFYKETDNTGTHTGSLWTASGTRLATGTFTGESASGWQELDFPTPVAVTAGTDLRRLLPHQHRALRLHLGRAGLGSDQRAADRAAGGRGRAALDPQWAGGRLRLISDGDIEVIVTAARTRPEQPVRPFTRWSLRKLAACLAEGPGVCTGRERLRQVLHARGISFQRTRTWKESCDPDRDAKLDRIEYVTSHYPDRCFASGSSGRCHPAVPWHLPGAAQAPVSCRRPTAAPTASDTSTAATASAMSSSAA